MIRVRIEGWASRLTVDDQTFGGVGSDVRPPNPRRATRSASRSRTGRIPWRQCRRPSPDRRSRSPLLPVGPSVETCCRRVHFHLSVARAIRREFFDEFCYVSLGSLARFRIIIRHHNILFSVGRADGRIQRFERRSGVDLCRIVDMNVGEYAFPDVGRISVSKRSHREERTCRSKTNRTQVTDTSSLST